MNKRMLYITFLNEELRPGYKKKIYGQCKAFSELGLKTELFICADKSFRKYIIEKKAVQLDKEVDFRHKRRRKKRNIYDEFFNFIEFSSHILRYLDSNKVDYIYMRRIIPLNFLVIKILKKAKKDGTKIIYEYPTLPWEEEVKNNPNSGAKMKFFLLMEKLYYNKLEKNVDCFTYIGRYDGTDKRYLRIQNAGSADDYKIVKASNNVDEIRMLGVAHVGYWTGYDLMIRALAEYYKSSPTIKVYFDIVGTVDPKLKLEEMVKDFGLGRYVLFHGMQTGDMLDSFFNEADIGINVLRLDSTIRHFDSMATLKTIEYSFRGLPQVAPLPFQIDCDGIDCPSFLKVVDAKNIDLYDIISFLKTQSPPYKIREYAMEHMSWVNVMKKVMDFMKDK